MKIFNKVKNLVPRYAYIPLFLAVLFNTIVFSGTKFILPYLPSHSFESAIDDAIPFVPFFISIYVLAYIQWISGYIAIGRESREVCYRIVMGDLVAKTICLICFLAYPTVMQRPDPSGQGFWLFVTRIVYAADSATNLFPSIHCLESWICFRGALEAKKMPKFFVPLNFVFALLVCASTVFVKQHVFVDIFAGIATAEIGLFISKKFKLGRIFANHEPKFARDKSDKDTDAGKNPDLLP